VQRELLSEMGTKNSNLLNTEILTADKHHKDKAPHFVQAKKYGWIKPVKKIMTLLLHT
jgi:hypothetical protein